MSESIDLNIEKPILKGLLQDNVVNITFNKKDGTKRLLRGTLNFQKIPQSGVPKSDNPWRTKSDDVQAVYDLDNDGWRSFRWDSLVDYEVELNLGEK